MPDPTMLPGGPAPMIPGGPSADPSQMPPSPGDSLDPSQMGANDPSQSQGDDRIISPEEKQTLLNIIDQIRAKLGSFHAVSFASNNKLESIRSDILKQVFEKLQLAGVDLTDKDSVAQFLAKLQQQNPELAAMFEKAMDALLGGQGISPSPQDPTQSMDLSIPPQNNMNNENPNEQQQAAPQDIPQG